MSESEQHSSDGSEGQTTPDTPLTRPESLSHTSEVEAIARLLGETSEEPITETPPPGSASPDEGEGEGADPGVPPTSEPPPLPTTLKELAEHLGVDAKTIYGVKVAIDGAEEPVSLGALKDAYQGRADLERETVKRETAITERESALVAQNVELQGLVNDLADKLDQETVQRYREKSQKQLVEQRDLLLQAWPEAKDSAEFDQFRERAAELMSSYGLPPHMQNITDHRVALILRDFIRTKDRLDRLLKFDPEKAPPPKKAKSRAVRPDPNAGIAAAVKRAQSGKEGDKQVAVAKLLGEL